MPEKPTPPACCGRDAHIRRTRRSRDVPSRDSVPAGSRPGHGKAGLRSPYRVARSYA